MKRIITVVLAFALVLGFGIGSAMAAHSLQKGNMSVSVGLGDSIFETSGVNVIDLSGRYLIKRDFAIIGGFGLQIDGGDADATYLSFKGGVRKYLKTDDFAPFFGGQLKIVMDQDDVANTDVTIFDLSAVLGAEVFLNKQFSMEGAVGVGFGQVSDDVANTDDTYFGTRTVGIRANLYF